MDATLLAVPSAATAAESAKPVSAIGDYELLHEIARGGMGWDKPVGVCRDPRECSLHIILLNILLNSPHSLLILLIHRI